MDGSYVILPERLKNMVATCVWILVLGSTSPVLLLLSYGTFYHFKVQRSSCTTCIHSSLKSWIANCTPTLWIKVSSSSTGMYWFYLYLYYLWCTSRCVHKKGARPLITVSQYSYYKCGIGTTSTSCYHDVGAFTKKVHSRWCLYWKYFLHSTGMVFN